MLDTRCSIFTTGSSKRQVSSKWRKVMTVIKKGIRLFWWTPLFLLFVSFGQQIAPITSYVYIMPPGIAFLSISDRERSRGISPYSTVYIGTFVSLSDFLDVASWPLGVIGFIWIAGSLRFPSLPHLGMSSFYSILVMYSHKQILATSDRKTNISIL